MSRPKKFEIELNGQLIVGDRAGRNLFLGFQIKNIFPTREDLLQFLASEFRRNISDLERELDRVVLKGDAARKIRGRR